MERKWPGRASEGGFRGSEAEAGERRGKDDDDEEEEEEVEVVVVVAEEGFTGGKYFEGRVRLAARDWAAEEAGGRFFC